MMLSAYYRALNLNDQAVFKHMPHQKTYNYYLIGHLLKFYIRLFKVQILTRY